MNAIIRSHHWSRWLLYFTLGPTVLYGVAQAAGPTLENLSEVNLSPNWTLLAVVGVGCVAYRLTNAAVWGRILTAVGHPIGARPAVRMWLLAEVCRWLPGSLWNLGSRAVLGARIGIPTPVVGAGMALEFVLTLGSWFLIGVVGSVWYEMALPLPFDMVTCVAVGMSFLTIAAIISMIPAIRHRLMLKIRGLATRFRFLSQLRLRRAIALEALLAYLALGLFQGATCWLLVRALAPDHEVSTFAVVSVNALAWLAGFVAVFAPAGLGVREGAFVVLLSPFIPWETCAAIAAIWRVFQIGAEIACLGLQAIVPTLGTVPADWNGARVATDPIQSFEKRSTEVVKAC